jgi:peptide-methionine (R)-S-oxide reductase
MTTRRLLMAGTAGLAATAIFAARRPATAVTAVGVTPVMAAPGVTLSEADWRRKLTPAQFNVLRESGTEMPFSSALDRSFAAGRYDCVGCGQHLYSSHAKFDSGTGWPSFYEPLGHAIALKSDGSIGMQRTEVRCGQCDGHLGHVFDDGPRPTGLRYCMNGVVLNFVPGQPA